MRKILHVMGVIAATMFYTIVAIPLVIADFLMSVVSPSWGFMPICESLWVLMNTTEEDL